MSDDRVNLLWVEKYRPKTVSECILPERIKGFFQSQVDSGDLHNLLLVGGAGTGKTSIAKAICSELGIDVLFINASENGNIDTLRTTIRTFASTISFNKGKVKCVILDESDYLTAATQSGLRAFIEEFANNCRFILTANFANRIIDPIKGSRCTIIDFSLTKEEKNACVMAFFKRMRYILDSEGITYDKKDVAELITKYYPDCRRIINEAQRNSHSMQLNLSSILSVGEESIKALIGHIKEKKFVEVRKWVVQNIDIDFGMLIRALFEKMNEYIVPKSIPDFILILNEYDYRRAFIVDVEIHTTAMLVQIMGEIDFK